MVWPIYDFPINNSIYSAGPNSNKVWSKSRFLFLIFGLVFLRHCSFNSYLRNFIKMIESRFLRQTTSFTCCARDHSVGSRARPLRAKDALRPPACGPALAGSGRRYGHILACGEDATSQNVKVKPALNEMRCMAGFFHAISPH